jgi:8-oxo-dGTP diphosphatase
VSRQAELNRIDVVAGILVNEHREVLIAERLGDGPFRGLWEFPGGKIGFSEEPEAALSRELAEELGIADIDSRFFLSLRHDYSDRSVSIDFFLVERWEPEPVGLEGQALRWVAIDELSAAELLPADAPVLAALGKLRMPGAPLP